MALAIMQSQHKSGAARRDTEHGTGLGATYAYSFLAETEQPKEQYPFPLGKHFVSPKTAKNNPQHLVCKITLPYICLFSPSVSQGNVIFFPWAQCNDDDSLYLYRLFCQERM